MSHQTLQLHQRLVYVEIEVWEDVHLFISIEIIMGWRNLESLVHSSQLWGQEHTLAKGILHE